MKLSSLLNEDLIDITETIDNSVDALEFLIEKIHKVNGPLKYHLK